MGAFRQWGRRYGRTVFWGKDARIAFVVAALACAAFTVWPEARSAGSDVKLLGATGTLGLAVLSLSLASVSLMAGLLDDTFSLAVGRAGETTLQEGIDDAVEPYRSMAVVGASTVAAAIVGTLLTTVVRNWVVDVLSLTIVTLLGTWSLAGTVQLVFLTAFFATQKGYMLVSKAEANLVRMEKRQGQSPTAGNSGTGGS